MSTSTVGMARSSFVLSRRDRVTHRCAGCIKKHSFCGGRQVTSAVSIRQVNDRGMQSQMVMVLPPYPARGDDSRPRIGVRLDERKHDEVLAEQEKRGAARRG